MRRKIVFVKVESSVIEISESVHWSRHCYALSFISVWNEILLWSQGTVNKSASCQNKISKTNCASHWRSHGRVRIEIKHLYPCFIAEINYGNSFWCVRSR